MDVGFRHTCTLGEVIALPQRRRLPAPSLVFSTRSSWRRGLSLAWNTLLARRSRQAPLLRLELHPGDAEHAAILELIESAASQEEVERAARRHRLDTLEAFLTRMAATAPAGAIPPEAAPSPQDPQHP